ncbi:hybrid sensor histidine kinase/response regulator [Marinobacterium sedimentorum]|uniref:hybrid sensor histidine kinase/response regulator n=1 Tax=Marinobacterium sedimentorum TaxID=2927804 RepID=UPI0020C6BA33|nr:NahK/ErcS family hybrid sensor histidine kinase/response regulator [Marinobacterium sedimentorum]MCP8686972.1 ATP-binding protein [Marinobacterium sedimentorum]
MKKRSDQNKPSEHASATFEDLIGLGSQSARKSYYPELERKMHELEQERNRYKWLFENALHGIFRADMTGGVLAANPAIAHLCGYDSPGQVIDQVRDLATELFVDPGEFAEIRQMLLASQRLTGYETRLRCRNGGTVDVAMNILFKQVDGGEIIEAFVADYTERKRARERLQQLNAELEQRVAERTEELLELNEQLRLARDAAHEANRSKDKYLAAASHDLLQPMNAARLLVSTLRERALEGQDGYLIERVHLALEGAEDLLTDLLDISRLDQNAVRPDLAEFSLQSILQPLAAELQSVAASEGLQLRLAPSRLNIRSDSRLLTRILRNFLSNALRYTERGTVLLGVRNRGDRVSIQVWDSGTGIAASKLEEIFCEFHQLPDHHAGERRGVGLGLAIVDRIARVLEHRVEVRSSLGKGSMFAVEVPRVLGKVAAAASEQLSVPLDSLAGTRVLVVDNDEGVLLSMCALLEQWGCELSVARDCEAALALCQANGEEGRGPAPQLLLADFHLDLGRTGLEVVQALRQQLGADFPAAMITADRSADTLQLFREQGLPVLPKPVRPGKLRALLTHLLQQAETPR